MTSSLWAGATSISDGVFSAKTMITASILQGEKDEEGFSVGSLTICKPPELKKFLNATKNEKSDLFRSSQMSEELKSPAEKCNYIIAKSQKKYDI